MNKLLSAKAMVNLFTLLLIITLVGCSSKPKETESDDLESFDSDQIINIDYLLPSPSEILSTIINEKIPYYAGLTALAGLEKNAQLTYQQSLLLGVYITDFSYNVMYKEHKTGSSYMNSIQVLTNKLGVGSLFYDTYFKRAEKNQNNIDSLDAIFHDFSENSFNTLTNSGYHELLSLVAMGASIEAMYVGYNTIDTKSIDDAVIPFLVEQKAIFDNFYKNFLEYNKDKPGLKQLIVDLEFIYNFFNNELKINIESKTTSTKDSNFEIKDEASISVDEEGVKTIGNAITKVRENIISLQYK